MISISLPPELDDFVSHEVASGHFTSPSELVCEAVRQLQDRELAELRAAIDIARAQIDSGDVIVLRDAQEVRNYADRFLEERHREFASSEPRP